MPTTGKTINRREFLRGIGGAGFVALPFLATCSKISNNVHPNLKNTEIPMAGQNISGGRVVLGGVQFAGVKGRKKSNIETAVRLIRRAASDGAQIVMTPEVALTGFVGGEHEKAVAETVPGPATDTFSALAKELDIYILLGLSELKDGQLYNSMAVISRKGQLMGVMRKVHINKYEIPGLWRNGSEFPVWRFETDTGIMTAGIMICYDRELPESARILMLKGADVIFNPLGTTCIAKNIHQCLLRTRAFENELYIFMVNRTIYSMAIDYEGNIAKQAGTSEEIIIYQADMDALNRYRAGGIYGRNHRRPELYKILCDPKGQIHPKGANLPVKQ